MITIDVGKDFSRFPSGRYVKNGNTSGEAFRINHLEPALRSSTEPIQIYLDGTIGYGSSFLEEAFGGLVRVGRFDADMLMKRLTLITEDMSLKLEVKEYILEAISQN